MVWISHSVRVISTHTEPMTHGFYIAWIVNEDGGADSISVLLMVNYIMSNAIVLEIPQFII